MLSRNQMASLVIEVQKGSREAFGELAEAFGPVVYGTVKRLLPNPWDAEDVTQETFMQAQRKIGQLIDPYAFPGWIQVCARREACRFIAKWNYRKRILREHSLSIIECGRYAKTTKPRVDALLIEAVGEALWQLPLEMRELLGLFYWCRLEVMQIAELFGVPAGTVKRRLFDARQKIKPLLKGVVV